MFFSSRFLMFFSYPSKQGSSIRACPLAQTKSLIPHLQKVHPTNLSQVPVGSTFIFFIINPNHQGWQSSFTGTQPHSVFMDYLSMFALYCKSRVEWLPQKSYDPQSRKYLLSSPSQRKFVNSTLDLGGSLLEKLPKWTQHQDWLPILRIVLHRKADHVSESLYHHAYTTTLQSMKTMLGITSRILGLPTWLLSAPSPSPCAFPPVLFHSMEFRKFCFLALEALFYLNLPLIQFLLILHNSA